MTILFKFVFGHYLMGHSSEALLAHYTVFTGETQAPMFIPSFHEPLLADLFDKINLKKRESSGRSNYQN
jgi:hypothetical protein